jgi:hypothetical protein
MERLTGRWRGGFTNKIQQRKRKNENEKNESDFRSGHSFDRGVRSLRRNRRVSPG